MHSTFSRFDEGTDFVVTIIINIQAITYLVAERRTEGTTLRGPINAT